MTEKKNIFIVEQSYENFDTWTAREFVSDEIRSTLKQASILIIPQLGFRDRDEPTFPVETESFLTYFKNNLPAGYTIDICIDDNLYFELALNSNYKRIGKFLVSTVALSIFLNLLSSYIYDKVIKEEESRPPIQINYIENSTDTTIANVIPESKAPKKYLEPPKIKFSVTVVDSNGTSKDFHYEGPAKDVKNVTDQIKQLWNEGEISQPQKGDSIQINKNWKNGH